MENEFIKSMARRIIAGKEPPAQQDPVMPPQDIAQPAQDPAASPALDQSSPTPNSEKAFDVKRVYYFNAPGDKAIPFSGLSASLAPGSADKDATVSKLKGGSGNSRADYFTWQKMVLKTNKYDPNRQQYVTYTCNLTGFGGKASSDISPDIEIPGIGKNKDDVIKHIEEDKDLGVFKNNIQGDNIINLDASTDSVYYNAAKTGIRLTFEDVKGLFDNYRVWGNNNMLMLPDMTKPTKDDVPGGYYFGGPAAFNRFVAPAVSKNETPSAPEQAQEQPAATSTTPFEPVDEQGDKTPVEGKIVDKTAKNKDKKRSEGDYASAPYSGGTDVMQRLFYDQAKCMKIRKAALKVAGRYLKDAGKGDLSLGVKTTDPNVMRKELQNEKKRMDLEKQQERDPSLVNDPTHLDKLKNVATTDKRIQKAKGITDVQMKKVDRAAPKVLPKTTGPAKQLF